MREAIIGALVFWFWFLSKGYAGTFDLSNKEADLAGWIYSSGFIELLLILWGLAEMLVLTLSALMHSD